VQCNFIEIMERVVHTYLNHGVFDG
jgi:hypothetical protein